MSNRGPLTDQELEEVHRLYPRNHPLRKMVRNATRAMGRPRSAEETLLFNDLCRQSELILNGLRNATRAAGRPRSAEETRLINHLSRPTELVREALANKLSDEVWAAITLTEKAHEIQAKISARKFGKKGPPAKRSNNEAFYRTLQHAFKEWKAKPGSSKKGAPQFYNEIRAHLPKNLRFFKKRLARNGNGFMTLRRMTDILRLVLPSR